MQTERARELTQVCKTLSLTEGPLTFEWSFEIFGDYQKWTDKKTVSWTQLS